MVGFWMVFWQKEGNSTRPVVWKVKTWMPLVCESTGKLWDGPAVSHSLLPTVIQLPTSSRHKHGSVSYTRRSIKSAANGNSDELESRLLFGQCVFTGKVWKIYHRFAGNPFCENQTLKVMSRVSYGKLPVQLFYRVIKMHLYPRLKSNQFPWTNLFVL